MIWLRRGHLFVHLYPVYFPFLYGWSQDNAFLSIGSAHLSFPGIKAFIPGIHLQKRYSKASQERKNYTVGMINAMKTVLDAKDEAYPF